MGITEPAQHIPRERAQVILEELKSDPNAGLVFNSGGAAANTAKIAAMLGVGAAFFGCVGSSSGALSNALEDVPDSVPSDAGSAPNGSPDGEPLGGDLAGFFENDLRAAGVVPFLRGVPFDRREPFQAEGGERTGLCFAFNCGEAAVRAGWRPRLAASPGASLELNEADIREDLIAKAEAVVLDGYMLDRRPLVQHILQIASRCGVPIALDAASVFQILGKTEDILQYSRNYPLIVFMNADETIAFYNTIKKSSVSPNFSGDREKEAFILKEICPVLKYITEGDIFPVIVIKLGSRGAVVLAGGNIYREETFSVTPRNTVGAGDAFCAAFISAWIRGKSIQECAVLGNKVARVILEAPAARVKSNKLKSLAKLLR
jgi:sugar/nucleoside kinase (ribokinase family)